MFDDVDYVESLNRKVMSMIQWEPIYEAKNSFKARGVATVNDATMMKQKSYSLNPFHDR